MMQCKTLCNFARKNAEPGFEFSSIQVRAPGCVAAFAPAVSVPCICLTLSVAQLNYNTTAKLHCDKNNLGNSAIVALGDYIPLPSSHEQKGGQLWMHSGEQIEKGKAIDLKNNFVHFGTCLSPWLLLVLPPPLPPPPPPPLPLPPPLYCCC
jgi:hypothetical protein